MVRHCRGNTRSLVIQKVMRADHQASLLSAGMAGALLLSGLAVYLAFRTDLPPFPGRLHFRPLSLATGVSGNTFLESLPNLIHVTALGLLTCAFFRPSVLNALIAGIAWAGIDVLWERSCADHQTWLRIGGELIGVGNVPACTFDGGDVVASNAGAAATVYIAGLVLTIPSVTSTSAREQRP